MLFSRRSVLLGGCAMVAGCGGGGQGSPPPPPVVVLPPPAPPPPPPPPPPAAVQVAFNFATNNDGFTADYADYSPGMEIGDQGIRFVSDIRRLPAPLDARTGLLVAGTNRSDDLFMFIWREVSGLVPGQRYRVETEVVIATNVPAGCVGVGGSPGEGVVIKAGASPLPPAKSLVQNRWTLNVDKDAGPLPVGGNQLFTIGDFSGGGGTCLGGIYALKTLRSPANRMPILTADATGRLWLVIGTDSGFEARTEIYYVEGSATFTPV